MTTILSTLITLFLLLVVPGATVPNQDAGEPVASVKIGDQVWSSRNLDVSRFRNGDPIFEANSYDAWERANIEGTPAWCYYNHDASEGTKYGKLYNFWAVKDKRGLAPDGWHVPNDEEWEQLATFLGGNDTAGAAMKSDRGWKKDKGGSGKAGFAALPGGYRSHDGPKYYGGPFFQNGAAGYWWSSTRYLVDNSFGRVVSYKGSQLTKDSFVQMAGLSVRLVKDTK